MAACGTSQDSDRSRRPGDAGLRPCGGGRRVRPLARGTLPRIRLADADRRQPDKRPVGLPERLRRGRPPRA